MMKRPGIILVLFSIYCTQMQAQFSNSPPHHEYIPEDKHVFTCHVSEEKTVPTGAQERYYDNRYGYRMRSINITEYKYMCINVILTAGKPITEVYHQSSSQGSVTSITFAESTIPLIPVGVFTAFTNLTELYLNNNFITSIHPGAFTGLTKLQQLFLQDNNLTKISQGILNSFPKLTILNLSKNQIEIIEEHTFLGLFSLEKIFLDNNKLKELQPDTFNGLNNLCEIDLSYNMLSDIPSNLFSGLHFLCSRNSVALSNNNLIKIDFSIFPVNLKFLMLQNNHINLIKNWSDLENILHLDLSNNFLENVNVLHKTLNHFNCSGNLIEHVNNSMFAQSTNLNILDISRNRLKNIDEDTFLSLENLIGLFLQNNQINSIPIGCFRDLKSLRELNLSSNEISEFEYGTFSGLSVLENLDISGNKLAYLYESSFHDLTNLRILNIKNNFITSFDPYDLKDHSNKLETIFLDSNPWVCKSLLSIVKILEVKNVIVVKGSANTKTNLVRGIACLNYNLYNTNTTYPPYFENSSENVSLAKLKASASEANAFNNFFNKDFLNSNFYKYFENFKKFNSTPNLNYSNNSAYFKYFDNEFKNTTFYKYFNKDFSNNSFFEHFDAASEKLSKTLNSLDGDLKNSSFYNFLKSDTISQNISKYFNDGFKNSGFYKYFAKEFSNSEFFKYFDKTLQARIDSNLLKIRNYFDNDFKNSTFFNEEYINRFNTNFSEHSELNANFARLTDNMPQINTNDVISKISELTDTIKAQEDAMQSARTGTAIFMTIVVIMLLTITLLLAGNHIRKRFQRNVCKPISDNTESQMYIADAEMELM